MAINIIYAGISTPEKKICNTIYQEGWGVLFNAGFDQPHKQPNDDLHHIVAKHGAKQAGIISWYVEESYKVPQVVVMMAYVRPLWREQHVFKRLHSSLVDMCKANGWGAINYMVNMHNRPMSRAQSKLGGVPEFITFQHEVKL